MSSVLQSFRRLPIVLGRFAQAAFVGRKSSTDVTGQRLSTVKSESANEDAAATRGWFDSSFDLRIGLQVVEVFEA